MISGAYDLRTSRAGLDRLSREQALAGSSIPLRPASIPVSGQRIAAIVDREAVDLFRCELTRDRPQVGEQIIVALARGEELELLLEIRR